MSSSRLWERGFDKHRPVEEHQAQVGRGEGEDGQHPRRPGRGKSIIIINSIIIILIITYHNYHYYIIFIIIGIIIIIIIIIIFIVYQGEESSITRWDLHRDS